MIAFLQGIWSHPYGERGVVMTSGGVGYEVFVTTDTALTTRAGDEVAFYIYTAVKEDAITLYAFQDATQKEMFLHLIKVSGVGARTALAALSTLSPAALHQAIIHGDIATVQRVPGVGRKMAEKIIVELKGSLPPLSPAAAIGNSDGQPRSPRPVYTSELTDAIAALVALGLKPNDAENRAQNALAQGATESAAIIRLALQGLGGTP